MCTTENIFFIRKRTWKKGLQTKTVTPLHPNYVPEEVGVNRKGLNQT